MLIWAEFLKFSGINSGVFPPKFERKFHIINIDTVFRYLSTNLTIKNLFRKNLRAD